MIYYSEVESSSSCVPQLSSGTHKVKTSYCSRSVNEKVRLVSGVPFQENRTLSAGSEVEDFGLTVDGKRYLKIFLGKNFLGIREVGTGWEIAIYEGILSGITATAYSVSRSCH